MPKRFGVALMIATSLGLVAMLPAMGKGGKGGQGSASAGPSLKPKHSHVTLGDGVTVTTVSPSPSPSSGPSPSPSPSPASNPSASPSLSPSSPPDGFVIVEPGTALQGAVNANPAGTSFLVQGDRTLNAPVMPKAGDGFFADTGASLDGGGTTPHAFTGSQNGINDVTIVGFVVQHFDPPPQRAALDLSPGTGWIIRNNDVSYNSTEGIEIYSGGRVINNHIHHNGQLGIFAYEATNAVISDNEVDHNNTAGFDPSVEAGGIKVSQTKGLQVLGNSVHDNLGPGIWTDTGDSGYLIQANTVTNNVNHGIKVESDATGQVLSNTVTNCGGGRDGINVDRSFGVTVAYNTVTASQGQTLTIVNGSTVDQLGNTFRSC